MGVNVAEFGARPVVAHVHGMLAAPKGTMHTTREFTADDAAEAAREAPQPGIVVIVRGDSAVLDPLPIGRGVLELGRGVAEALADESISRRHASLAFDGRRWTVRDHGSRNGTLVDGERVVPERVVPEVPGRTHVLRLGRVLALLVADLRAFAVGVTVENGVVSGPTLTAAWREITAAARAEGPLHVVGESGSGKELAAARFHADACGGTGPLVSVNCATIPQGLAERVLFGALRGAYSGAERDTEGYVQAAEGGTLFLDEIAELDALVQAKLLRVLETREVTPLGGVKARRVTFRLCTATHRDLRAAVTDDRFREDLYYRIGRPAVRIPPLRERLEEIPWIIAQEVARAKLAVTAHPSFVEACLLRRWPGNVRELLAEVRTAAQKAALGGRTSVGAADLAERAGEELAGPERAEGEGPGRREVEEALERAGGNVSAAARSLGVHRNQLRRLIARHRIDSQRFAKSDDD